MTLLLTIILLAIISNPIISNAEEDLTISNWKIESNLLENGDLEIIEDITFKFDAEYNGVFREIVLENTLGIEGIKVVEKSKNKVLEYSRVERAKKGDKNVFLVNQEKKGVKIQIFSPSEDEEKIFRLIYTVKNVAKKYNDVGELYYKFLGSENETPIRLFNVNIMLPGKDENNKVKFFAHGPLNGQIFKASNDTVNLRVENVPENTFVEGRILFPREFISISQNIINKDSYSDIMKEEARLKEKIEQDIAKRESRSKVFGNIAVILAAIEILIFTMLFIRYKRPKNFYENKNYSTIPDDHTPAVVSYIMSSLISNHTIIATILDLYRKGYLKVDDEEELKKNKETLREFSIIKIKEEDNNLLNHEKYFIRWLIDDMGDGKAVTTKDIEKYSKEQSTMFQKHYTKWIQLIKEDSNNKGYFDSSTKKYSFPLAIVFIIGFILSIIPLLYENLLGLTLMGTSLLILIQGIILTSRKSDYGYDQQRKWQDFKKYMNNFKKEDSVNSLDQYPKDMILIYGLALGIDAKVLDKFNIKLNHKEDTFMYANGWMYWYFFLNNNKNNEFNQSINNSFSGGGGTGTGGGAGFSPGGGGGIGGGGAGGF